MSPLRSFRSLLRRPQLERELDEELRFHIDMQTEENLRRGMSAEEARRQAILLFGGVEGHREAARDARGTRLVEQVAADARYGARALLRAPGFTAVAVLTLGLGIGANTALFSLISGALWTPPPGVEAAGLHWATHLQDGRALGLAYPDYLAWRDESGVFSELSTFIGADVAMGGEGEPERLKAELVTGNYFSVLRVRPELGRGFVAEEDRTPGTHPVAVIGHDLWRRRFGGAADVVGRRVTINGEPFTVVGVAPEGFRGLDHIEEPTDLWVPMAMHGAVAPGRVGLFEEVDQGTRGFRAVGRLRPGTTPESARAPLETLTHRAAAALPEAYEHVTPGLFPFRSVIGPTRGGDMTIVLSMAAAVTLMVLLIACGNVANLLLARAAGRSREIAVRAAIGASRGRIVRQLLVESLLLALLGGAAGMLLAISTVRVFLALAPVPFPLPVALDERALLATLALALATGIVFGISPALRASRADLTVPLRGATHGGRGRARPQRALVIGQLALSFLLLVTAGLLLSRLQRAIAVDEPFAAGDEVLTLAVDPRTQGYTPEEVRAFQSALIERAAALPGVEAASLTGRLPSEGRVCQGSVFADGVEQPTGEWCVAAEISVWPAFFRTLGIPVRRGRDFTLADRKGAGEVAIVNETAAARFWPGADPIGHTIRLGDDTMPAVTVIGVVPDVAHDRDGASALATVYRPEPQRESVFSTLTLLVRGRDDAAPLAGPLRAQIRELDPDLPVFAVRTMAQVTAESRSAVRLGSTLLLLFGGLALLLAAVGLHGVVAFAVVQRTREMGIRMALGATSRQIVALFGGDTLRVAGIGVGLGLLLAAAAGKVLSSIVQGLEPADALTVAAVAGVLVVAALLAALVPARRATRVDAMVSLRSE